MLPTCVVQNEPNHVLDLLDCEIVLGPLCCVPMYSCYWSILQITRLDVLEAFDPHVVQKQKGWLIHMVALVRHVYPFLFCRTVTWGLEAVVCPMTNKSSSSWVISANAQVVC